jgi:dTDP-4-dehydrorhamnose reductase
MIVVEACRRYNAKLVYISTDYVFDGENESAWQENDRTNPLNAYGRSKLKGEEYVQSLLTEYLIVRTSWLFGSHGKNFVATIIDKAAQLHQLQVVNDQRGSPTYTVSLASALNILINKVFLSGTAAEHCGLYHISNAGNCSWYEFARTIVEAAKLSAAVIPVDSATFKRPAKRPRRSILDTGRYERVTGQKLCGWQEALRGYLAQRG